MFCPNCGTQNPDPATTCQKCGFNIKGSSVPKFKGTMLMMNAPAGVQAIGGQPPAEPATGVAPTAAQPVAPTAGMPMGQPAAPAAAQPPAAQPPAAQPPVRSKLMGTMIGVAPPSLGAQKPTEVGFPPARGAMPPTAPQAEQPSAPKPAAVAPVNPLGGTMVADAGGFGYPASPFNAPSGQAASHAASAPTLPAIEASAGGISAGGYGNSPTDPAPAPTAQHAAHAGYGTLPNLPSATGPMATGPMATGPMATGPMATGPMATGPIGTQSGPSSSDVGWGEMPNSVNIPMQSSSASSILLNVLTCGLYALFKNKKAKG